MRKPGQAHPCEDVVVDLSSWHQLNDGWSRAHRDNRLPAWRDQLTQALGGRHWFEAAMERPSPSAERWISLYTGMDTGLINSSDKQGRTALHLALQRLHLLQDAMQDPTAEPDCADDGIVALQPPDRLGVIRALLAVPGLDLHAEEHSGHDAVALAIRWRLPDALALLLADPRCASFDEALLQYAIEQGCVATLEVLLRQGGAEAIHAGNVEGLFRWAVLRGEAAQLDTLLALPEVRRYLTKECLQAGLSAAASMGHMALVRALVERHGADINACPGPGLSATEKVRFLLKRDDSNLQHDSAWTGTPLFRAAAAGHVELVRYFLGRPELQPEQENPLLLLACEQSEEDIDLAVVAALLKDSRVDVNAVDDDGHSVLRIALEREHCEFVLALLQHPDIAPSVAAEAKRAELSEAPNLAMVLRTYHAAARAWL